MMRTRTSICFQNHAVFVLNVDECECKVLLSFLYYATTGEKRNDATIREFI